MNNVGPSGSWDMMELVDQVTWPPELDMYNMKGLVGQWRRLEWEVGSSNNWLIWLVTPVFIGCMYYSVKKNLID